tara:strand:+ start:14 stop:349 length:336 start_codon:yes stop_codon:yes gene_type:complete
LVQIQQCAPFFSIFLGFFNTAFLCLPGAGDYEIRLYANNSYELLADATFSIGGDAPPAINIVRNGNGTITVTFEGKLQTAATVNGPWQDVDSVSPLTLNTDETVHFVRAVR